MLATIYTVLHIALILIIVFVILIAPPKYFTKWYNKKRMFHKSHNETKIYTLWFIFLLIMDIIISLIFF